MSKPRFTVIAGANGSGKTTLTRWDTEGFRAIPLLDPDSIAKTLRSEISESMSVTAARHVLKVARRHIDNRESFAVETTLSGILSDSTGPFNGASFVLPPYSVNWIVTK